MSLSIWLLQSFKEAQPLTEVIYSNVDEVVAQGQYVFDTLWRHSTSAFKRIREIEYGIEPIKTIGIRKS